VNPVQAGGATLRQAFSCASEVNILGAFFPAWMISIVLGLVLSALLRAVFVRTGLEPHLGPPALIYPCLVIVLTLSLWLAVFSG